MPGGDGTGPLGLGPRTGRAMGYCAGYGVPGYMNPVPGRGAWGRGRGLGRGFGRGFRRFWRCFGRGFGWRRWGFVPITPVPAQQGQVWEPVQVQLQAYQPTKEQELQMLEQEAKTIEQEQEALRQELEDIRKRIKELEKQK